MVMFTFSASQKVYEIGGVKVGGEIGENATVLIGSMFYLGDRIVQDEKEGVFDREKAEGLIRRVEELSDKTGLQAMLDIVCSTGKVAAKYLEFAADVTEMPILIDAVAEEAAIKGLEHAKELGIVERTVLNSITPETKEPVYRKIKEVGLEAAVLLTFSSKAIISSSERVRLLEAMIPKVEEAGIVKPLVDTVVLDISTLGLACKAMHEVKDRFGYPAGCAPHNAVASWKALKRKDKKIRRICSSVVNALPAALGADFILYGPIKSAEYVFHAVTLIDASYGQVFMEGGRRLNLNHPRFKILRF